MIDHDNDETPPMDETFDFTGFPENTLFHDRRSNRERRTHPRALGAGPSGPERPPRRPVERRAKKERRRRIDPTTFEKQYTEDEIEFMNAMQHFKMQTGRAFPTYGEVLRVASALGYQKVDLPTAPGPIDLSPRRDGSSDDSHDVAMALSRD